MVAKLAPRERRGLVGPLRKAIARMGDRVQVRSRQVQEGSEDEALADAATLVTERRVRVRAVVVREPESSGLAARLAGAVVDRVFQAAKLRSGTWRP